MKIISHRGNINGKNLKLENNPDHIEKLSKIIDCEIDVWMINKDLFLGHDKPEYKIKKSFLKNPNLWCHAKNLNALKFMLNENIVCFYHNTDDFTLTSNGFIWTYPFKEVCEKSIIVDTRKNWNVNDNYKTCYGICSDYINI